MRFSERCRRDADGTWSAQFEHPFVVAFSRGELDDARFRFYFEQDYVFLAVYARVFAACAAHAPNVDLTTRFAELTIDTTMGEMALHREYGKELGIQPTELEAAVPGKATNEYGAFLEEQIATGRFPELIASFLPCFWSYGDIASSISDNGPPADDRIARWLGTYASDEWHATLAWLRDALDDAAAHLTDDERNDVAAVFCTASRHDLAFWDMCWQGPTPSP